MNEKKICVSSWLFEDSTVSFVGEQLVHRLMDIGIEINTLTSTSDYWCRDYMPVHIGNGRYVGYHNQNP